MIRIGVVNIDTSHPKAFAEYMKKDNRARYTAVYNDGFRGDDEVNHFVDAYGLEKRCESIDELADCVDMGFIQGCNWDKHIEHALPFIQRGKPVFIDKPMVGSMEDCIRLEELADRGGAIFGSSSVRYASEIEAFLNRSPEEVGEIVNVFGTSGVDEFNYGIHIVEGIGGLLGGGAVSCKFIGSSNAAGRACDSFFITYGNGCTAIYNTFYGVWHPFEMVIMTTKSTYRFRIDTNRIYGALLDRIFDSVEKGEKYTIPIRDLTESVKVMLAGRISKEGNGLEIGLKDIPADYIGYNGKVFERQYAASASKIYL